MNLDPELLSAVVVECELHREETVSFQTIEDAVVHQYFTLISLSYQYLMGTCPSGVLRQMLDTVFATARLNIKLQQEAACTKTIESPPSEY